MKTFTVHLDLRNPFQVRPIVEEGETTTRYSDRATWYPQAETAQEAVKKALNGTLGERRDRIRAS